MNSPMAQTLSRNQTLHGRVAYNLSYGHFCDIFGLFWPKFGCHGNTPYTLAIRNVLFGLVDPQNHTLKPIILSIAVTQGKLCRFEGSRQV